MSNIKVYDFLPNYHIVANVPGLVSITELERETGMYSATPAFVRLHGGPIANRILDAVPNDYYVEAKRLGLYPNVDIRIHRLYVGNYPAYPGWHCDGEYRETYFSQPRLDHIPVSHHITCTVSTHADGVSNTQFLTRPFRFESPTEPTSDNTLWKQVHRAVETVSEKPTWDSRDGQLVSFDSWTLHRAMPAKTRGWRLFFRMAMWHKPNLGDGGMISKQEQVYLVEEGTGW